MKTYTAAEVELILEWVDRYFKVSSLINKAFSSNDPENCPCLPSMEDEIEYHHQRSWFRKNHEKFVPIWKEFCLSNGILMDFDGDIDWIGYIEDPFFYYYPDNLRDVPYWMGTAGSADDDYLDEQDKELVLCINRRFSYTAIHLAHWIGEFAENVN
jgi:hypothetical protein